MYLRKFFIHAQVVSMLLAMLHERHKNLNSYKKVNPNSIYIYIKSDHRAHTHTYVAFIHNISCVYTENRLKTEPAVLFNPLVKRYRMRSIYTNVVGILSTSRRSQATHRDAYKIYIVTRSERNFDGKSRAKICRSF